MTSGDWVAIAVAAVTVIMGIIGWVIAAFVRKNQKIALLETKCELLEKSNGKLERQNLKLEITGQLAAQFFKQLPPAVQEYNEESG